MTNQLLDASDVNFYIHTKKGKSNIEQNEFL